MLGLIQQSLSVFCSVFYFLNLCLFDCIYLFIVLSTAVSVFILYCAIWSYGHKTELLLLLLTQYISVPVLDRISCRVLIDSRGTYSFAMHVTVPHQALRTHHRQQSGLAAKQLLLVHHQWPWQLCQQLVQ